MDRFPITIAKTSAGIVSPKFTAKTPAPAIPLRRLRLDRNKGVAVEDRVNNPPTTIGMPIPSKAIVHEKKPRNAATKAARGRGKIGTMETRGAGMAPLARK